MTALSAEISDYDTLIVALRKAAVHRNLALTSDALNELAGFPERYMAKLLALPKGEKIFGPNRRGLSPMTLGPVLKVLGVKLMMVEDPEWATKMAHRLTCMTALGKVNAASARDDNVYVRITHTREHLRAAGAKGRAVKRLHDAKAKRRSEICRKAAEVRWANRLATLGGDLRR